MFHPIWCRVSGESPDAYLHFRACRRDGSPKPIELKKHDFVSAGRFQDLVDLEDVLDAFRAFHQAGPLPASLEWRDLEV